MAFDPTAFAEAAKEALGIAKPLVDDAVQQKYESAHRYRMEAWNEAQNIKDNNSRYDASWSAILRILSEGGKATGSHGALVGIASDTLANLVELASEGIRDKALLNRKK